MRITTRAVFQMTDDPAEFVELERESYEYEGAVAEAGKKGGGGSSTTTVQKADPWGPLQPYIKDMLPGFDAAAYDIPSYYPGQTYANFDPLQEWGMMGSLNHAQALTPTTNNMLGALNQGLDATNPYSNIGLGNALGIQAQANNMVNDPYADPTLQAWLGAAQRPLTESYENTVGNAIAGGAASAGGLGGSRQGVAEGEASGNYLDAMGDLSANTYANAFNRALTQQLGAGELVGNTYGDAMNQQARMQALAPSVLQSSFLPYDVAQQVGGAYQGQQQRAIDEAFNRYNFNQTAPFNRGTDYFNTLMGQGFGTNTTTGPNPNQGNQFAQGLGGAALGYGLGTQLFPAGSFLGAGPAGIGLGPMGLAGIGLLGGIFG